MNRIETRPLTVLKYLVSLNVKLLKIISDWIRVFFLSRLHVVTSRVEHRDKIEKSGDGLRIQISGVAEI